MKKSQNQESKRPYQSFKGITLVALVITIVVLLILAGVSVVTLFGENGIITKAQKAKTETENGVTNDISGMESLTDNMDEALGAIKAKTVAKNPTTYYGKTVNYVAGSENFQNELGVNWRIFYADDNHIYLKASDYVPVDKLPYSTNASGTATTNKPTNIDASHPRGAVFGSSATDGVMQDYLGSERVPEKVKYLNSSYFNYLTTNNTTSTRKNMKAVSYMLDTKAWEGYKDSNGKADFVIGGPTVEMLMASYNQTHEDIRTEDKKLKYQVEVTGLNGYKISNNYGDDWKFAIDYCFTTSDDLADLYVLSNKDKENNATADAYWIASPIDRSGADSCVCCVQYDGRVAFGLCTSTSKNFGFCPIVSLKSNVKLIEQEDGTLNIE